MKTEEEIRNKIEEINKMLSSGKIDIRDAVKYIYATDVLSWVLSEENYLDTQEDGKICW